MTNLPTTYATGDSIGASTDSRSGGGINGWTTAINANTDLLNGTAAGTATLKNPTVNGYTEAVQALGTVGATATVGALTNGTLVTATLTASTATTFTLPSAAAGESFVLILHQPGTTGAATATFTGVKWPGGTAPTITATAGAIDILSFVSDGTNWYGNYAQAFA